MDYFTTIAAPSEGEYKDKGSKFIAYAYPLATPDELKAHLEPLRAQHPKACHFCYAWRIGTDKQNYRANDDGEPSGSAGKPILGQIDSVGVTNILVVVVRYYGGTNLGVPGLIKAYKTSTAEALRQAQIIQQPITVALTTTCTYVELNAVLQILKRHQATVTQKVFDGNDVLLHYQVIASATEAVENALAAWR